jgi:hypothetical protein
MGRVKTLHRMFKYMLTIPDFIAEHHNLRNIIVRKTHEFKRDPRAAKLKPVFDAVLTLCKELS